MGIALRLSLIALPLMEIAAFVLVGQAIGVGATLLLVLAAAFAGALLVKSRGLALLARFRDMARRGEWPGEELFDDVLLMLAGLLLILPGFVSDAVALALLLGPVRRAIHRWGRSHVERAGGERAGVRAGPRTIDAEYKEVPADAERLADMEKPDRPSKWGRPK
jgi:UPF0716 protein FxsA